MNQLQRIIDIIPETHNMWESSRDEVETLAMQWLDIGIDSIEVWDWAMLGYHNPYEVHLLKLKGYNVLNITEVVKKHITNKFKDVATVNITDEGKRLYIDVIHVKETNRGSGTLIMKEIIFLADVLKKNVYLHASDFMDSDLNRLVEFYKSFGFHVIENQWNGIYMGRYHS